jgi:hypothetical protein
MYTRGELLDDIDSAQLLYHVAVYCLSPIEKLFSGDDDRHIAEN